MKWVVYLFSLYVVILSGIPCQDRDACCADEWEHATTAHPKEQEADHQAYGICSPFFVCGTCHLSVVPNNPINLSEISKLIIRLPYTYLEEPLRDFHYSIWQPPQLA